MTPTDTTSAAYAEAPAGVELRADEGVLEIKVPGDAEVLVDGSPRGHGPSVRVTLVAGRHEVRVGTQSHHADVQAGRMLVLDVSSP